MDFPFFPIRVLHTNGVLSVCHPTWFILTPNPNFYSHRCHGEIINPVRKYLPKFKNLACGDVVKKPKLDQHRGRCHAGFDCIDCHTTFNGPLEYKGHTQCISEAQKYQKSLYKGPKKVRLVICIFLFRLQFISHKESHWS
jgi:hypothetical protein